MNRWHEMVLRISLKKEAMAVDRATIGDMELAYVICTDRKIPYRKGRSRIVYIGTTKNGIHRVAQAAAARADMVFRIRGVDRFTVHILTCARRRRVKTWHKLERALLMTFRERFGEVPKLNTRGEEAEWRGEEGLFRKANLASAITDLG